MTPAEAASRCRMEIDLDQMEKNLMSARARVGKDARVFAVLKADAYGTGAQVVAPFLRSLGVDFFCVASVSEALELRAAAPGAQVLVMGTAGFGAERTAVKNDLVLCLSTRGEAEALSAAARLEGRPARVHVKLDTGLHRLGFLPEDTEEILSAARLPGIKVEGLFTHLALHNREADLLQLRRFRGAAEKLRRAGLIIPLLHALDSIGMTRYPEARFGAVRLGAWLYGVRPSGVSEEEDGLVARLVSRVTRISRAAAGELIGYDDDNPLPFDAKVATVFAGYADGYPRLSFEGEAEIRGRRAKLIGLVGMDQMMLDASPIEDAAEGDEAVLLGDGISIAEYAAWGRRNRNEALARVSRRVPRVYLRGGRPYRVLDEMSNTVWEAPEIDRP